MRNVFLVIMVLLALIGIPVVPPNKIEMDKENEIKTEISDESEKD